MDFDVLDKAGRCGRLQLLEKRVNLFKKLKAKRDLTDAENETYLADLKDLVRLRRIDRAESDVLYFMYEYFSDERNPANEQNLIPAGVDIQDAPEFHQELCSILSEVSSVNTTARVAWAAPRGHAKSAYLSNCFPVHQICYNLRKYILIISETDTSAKKFVEWVSLQLKFNEKLRQDFGELLAAKKALNDRDNQEAFLTKNGILVEAASMGKQLRGKRNGSFRPDLVICDDLESQKNTNTKELREKNLHWFNSVVMPIGTPESTAFIYMGKLDRKRTLRFTLNSLVEIEDRLGVPLAELGKVEMGIKTVRTLLWAGLIHEDENLTEFEVGNLVDFYNLEYIQEKISQAFEAATGKNS